MSRVNPNPLAPETAARSVGVGGASGHGARLPVTMGLAALVLTLGGCASMSLPTRTLAPQEEAVVQGPPPRRNATPMEAAFTCLADGLRAARRPVPAIAVGDVKDYTGKYSQNEGSAITQGGALMIYSALGKLGNVVQVQERFDTRIGELELAYSDRRQLGDGRQHAVEPGKPPVPWVPYFGGSILRSNFYIVGGITEVNYNIYSGGGEVGVSGVGGKRRVYSMNVGVDLRIVDSRTLVVLRTVSLQKQINGEEVGLGIYRFFNSELLDINVGAKKQEPLQLGVRTTIEQGVIELVAAVMQVDARPCLASAAEMQRAVLAGRPPVATPWPDSAPAAATAPTATPAPAPAPAPAIAPAPTSAAAARPPQPLAPTPASASAPVGVNGPAAPGLPVVAVNAGAAPTAINAGNGAAPASGGLPQVGFDFSSAALAPASLSVIERVVKEARTGASASLQLVARDSEQLAPLQRRELTNQRVRAVTEALQAGGIAPSRIGTSWLPDPTDPGIVRLGAGLQHIATIAIGR